jgi:hypothetical protein
MSMDERRRRKAAEKRKHREKRVAQEKARQRGAGEGGSHASPPVSVGDLPLGECVISKGWKERGLAHLLLTRRQPDGKLLVGGWYVDTFCLGLKDCAVIPNVEEGEYQENLKPNLFNDDVTFEPCKPAFARALVEGAIAFAGQYGFKPAKRWEQSRPLFVEEAAGSSRITFGKGGKPCYVKRGETNAQGILARLERKVGPGNYLVENPPEG